MIQLSKEQKLAVIHKDKPALVLAAAGSGKTRVVTARAANLIHTHSINPKQILILTFTNKAANEIKARLVANIGNAGTQVVAGTFHSIFLKALRQHASKLGYRSNFNILDMEDAKRVLSNVLDTVLPKSERKSKDYDAKLLMQRISALKSNGLSPESCKRLANGLAIDSLRLPTKTVDAFAELLKGVWMRNTPLFLEIYTNYCNACKAANSVDFDDILTNYHTLLKDESTLPVLQNEFQYIMVDEFQDTNWLQYDILMLLSASHGNIYAVGDDSQSIYGFRGAVISNILNFERVLGAKRYTLSTNYRSTKTIVNASDAVISHNTERIAKSVESANGNGNRIVLYKALDNDFEAGEIIYRIHNLINKSDVKLSEIAILYRTSVQRRESELALSRAQIPYKVYGDLSFYQKREIKDVLAYAKLVVNPLDNISFKRVVNYPKRGIGNKAIDILQSQSDALKMCLFDAIPKKHSKLFDFRIAISKAISFAANSNAFEVLKYLVSTFDIRNEIQRTENPNDAIERILHIDSLLSSAERFCLDNPTLCDLTAFLESIALLTDKEQSESLKESVSLMTVHKAKGLEWSYVFLIGCEDSTFPSHYATSGKEAIEGEEERELKAIEEERRLFYVAMTRAKTFLHLSYRLNIHTFQGTFVGKKSRFLNEIPHHYLD